MPASSSTGADWPPRARSSPTICPVPFASKRPLKLYFSSAARSQPRSISTSSSITSIARAPGALQRMGPLHVPLAGESTVATEVEILAIGAEAQALSNAAAAKTGVSRAKRVRAL